MQSRPLRDQPVRGDVGNGIVHFVVFILLVFTIGFLAYFVVRWFVFLLSERGVGVGWSWEA